MARVRKVELTSEEIKAQITSIEEQITKLTEDIKGLRVQKKNLSKDLVAAEKKEAAAKEEQSMKNLAKLLREKGLSVEDVRNMLDKESNTM
jgi:proline dehydrogenase